MYICVNCINSNIVHTNCLSPHRPDSIFNAKPLNTVAGQSSGIFSVNM
jgi:hypothetical protein